MTTAQLIELARARLEVRNHDGVLVEPSGYRLAVEAERIWRQKGKPPIEWRISLAMPLKQLD